MIAYIKGKVIELGSSKIIIETSGIGYEVFLCENDISKISAGAQTELYISTSFSMYEGEKLYGFLSAEEKEIFELLENFIPNTGAKKAMEYLNKILKSVSDFKKAILNEDEKMLKNLFGFTPKTSKKLIVSLKDKIDGLRISDKERYTSPVFSSYYETALNALIGLGYKSGESRAALAMVMEENTDKNIKIEDVIKLSLKKLSGV
ncbi:MAG: Holliday junction branch migration protein RuvA [Elusimicrobiales bacterium]|nr:Holliday junction branch migration protein RuvA [Elusimicrobiales bacterium]NLH39291.1 Holliday junction branch migration protein RuvA [Elusimicrobiota bacterium]